MGEESGGLIISESKPGGKRGLWTRRTASHWSGCQGKGTYLMGGGGKQTLRGRVGVQWCAIPPTGLERGLDYEEKPRK